MTHNASEPAHYHDRNEKAPQSYQSTTPPSDTTQQNQPASHHMQQLADPSTAAVSFRGLGKTFGEKVAVYPFAFDVPRGSFYGLVGPNGAGKTTTLSVLTGLLRPDMGHAYVHGVDVWERPLEAKQKLGVLADGMRLFDRLSGRQLITYTGRLRGMDAAVVG